MNIQKFQSAVGWNEAYCTYLDYFCTVDISYIAPHHQRSRNDNTITMKSGDPDLQAFPMAKREDFKKTTKDVVRSLKRTRENSFIRKDITTRQRDELDPAFPERLEWLSRHWREAFFDISTSSTWTQHCLIDDKLQEERWKGHQRWRSEWTVFNMHLETVAYTVKFWRRHQGWEIEQSNLRLFFQQVSFAVNSDSFVRDVGCRQHTASHAHVSQRSALFVTSRIGSRSMMCLRASK